MFDNLYRQLYSNHIYCDLPQNMQKPTILGSILMSKIKSVPLIWSLCLILMVSTVAFISCQEPSMSNFGSLTVSTKAIGSKTISPGSTEIAVVSYHVTVIGLEDVTFSPVTSDSSPITVPDLIEGQNRLLIKATSVMYK